MRHITLIMALVALPVFAGGLNNQQQHQSAESSAQAGSKSHSVSKAGARAGAHSGSYSNSGGNRVSARTGESTSSADATGGTAQGGNASVEGDTVLTEVNYERQIAPAAALFTDVCQSGLSVSAEDFGFSNVGADQFCTLMRMSDANWKAHINAMDCRPKDIDIPVCKSDCKPGDAIWKDGMPVPKCTARCTKNEASITYSPPSCRMTPEAQHYLELYHKNLKDAQALVDNTNATGTADRASGQMVKPAALIGGLVGLIRWLF